MKAEVRPSRTVYGQLVLVVWLWMDLGLGRKEWVAVGRLKP